MKRVFIPLCLAILGGSLAASGLVAANQKIDTVAYAAEIDGFSGSGTEADPYLIQSNLDMAAFKAGLKNDKDPDTTKVYEGLFFKLTADADLTLSETCDGEGQFWGVFDGNNHEVNLIQNCASTTNHLAFINVNYNIIKNVVIRSSTGLTVAHNAAGVVNFARKGQIVNCINYANITSSTGYVGGIANVCSCEVSNCQNYGVISDSKPQASSPSTSLVGGVIGQAQKGSFINRCKNFATVKGTRGFGGVIGGLPNDGTDNTSQANYVYIKGCENYGYVDGRTNHADTDAYPGCVGGITSYISAYTIMEDCSNFGEVSAYNRGGGGFSPVGGLCGHTNGAHTTIRNCVNAANVTATNLVGGIFGWDGTKAYATITNCIQAGNVVADGLGGDNVQGDGNCGGLFGVLDKTATITDVYLLGTATATGSKTTYVNNVVGNDKANQNVPSKITDYHNVNDSARLLVKEVRKFECSDISSSLYASISPLIEAVQDDVNSDNALSDMPFTDKFGVSGTTYLMTANYIANCCYSNSHLSMFTRWKMSGNAPLFAGVAAISITILAIAVVLLMKKRKHN